MQTLQIPKITTIKRKASIKNEDSAVFRLFSDPSSAQAVRVTLVNSLSSLNWAFNPLAPQCCCRSGRLALITCLVPGRCSVCSASNTLPPALTGDMSGIHLPSATHSPASGERAGNLNSANTVVGGNSLGVGGGQLLKIGIRLLKERRKDALPSVSL